MTDSSRKGNVPRTGSDRVKGVVGGERGLRPRDVLQQTHEQSLLETSGTCSQHQDGADHQCQSASASSSEFPQPTMKHQPIELLLFLMHLSVGLPLRDLAERFDFHNTTASRNIATWTHFLYNLLGSQRLRIPRETVRAQLPPEF
ncbi:hypothetical protein UPYG_G00021710 [Umbra pygmaea]|uniref:Transposase Helix-turn-helix domain-containing protein n=1 Tax=Umbra pygmaea TaxID=75934 RepID=A0ABD0XKZ4_UMBPY